MIHLRPVLPVLLLLACASKAPSASVERVPSPVPADRGPAVPVTDDPFAAWDMTARRAALEGAHVAPGSSFGAPWEAWNVQGDQVTVWDGVAEHTLAISLLSPCEIKRAEPTGGFSIGHYTTRGGVIVMGLGDAGSHRGDEAIACVSDLLFTLDASGGCTQWRAPMFDGEVYASEPGTCSFKTIDGKRVFAATANDYEYTLDIVDDALLSTQLAGAHSEPVADWAAAKAARDTK